MSFAPVTITHRLLNPDQTLATGAIRATLTSKIGNGETSIMPEQLVFYTYDADENLTAIKDPAGNSTSYTYDAANRQTTITRADQSTLASGYDANGNLTSQTDGANNTTSYTYDVQDRVATVTDPLNHTTSYGYDQNGNLTTITDPDGRVTTNTYDRANDLTAISYSDGHTPSVGYAYNADGQRTKDHRRDRHDQLRL